VCELAADAPLEKQYRDVDDTLADDAYLRMAVREGSLDPADEATARLCGVPWKQGSPV